MEQDEISTSLQRTRTSRRHPALDIVCVLDQAERLALYKRRRPMEKEKCKKTKMHEERSRTAEEKECENTKMQEDCGSAGEHIHACVECKVNHPSCVVFTSLIMHAGCPCTDFAPVFHLCHITGGWPWRLGQYRQQLLLLAVLGSV